MDYMLKTLRLKIDEIAKSYELDESDIENDYFFCLPDNDLVFEPMLISKKDIPAYCDEIGARVRDWYKTDQECIEYFLNDDLRETRPCYSISEVISELRLFYSEENEEEIANKFLSLKNVSKYIINRRNETKEKDNVL